MTTTADVVIVGGGIIGTAIASYLSQKEDVKILLLEQNQFCTGSTSLSASLATKLRHQTNLIPLVEETHEAVKRMTNKFGEALGERRVGCLHIAASGNSLIDQLNLTEIAEDFDIDFEILKNYELQTLVPWLNSEKIFEVVFVPDEFYIDGTLLGMAYLKEAKQNGVEARANTQVCGILIEKNKTIGVRTNDEIIHAPIVVDAAGIWSNLLLEEHNLLVSYTPVRSLYFITEVNSKLYPGNQPICIMPDANAYSRPESGALLFGIRDQKSPWIHPYYIPENINDQKYISLDEQWEILTTETEGLQNLMLNFDDLKVAYTIAAPCAYTHDGNLISREHSKLKGLFTATGCNGAGIATSAGIGRVMAELILGETPFVNVKRFSTSRSTFDNPFSEEFMQTCSNTRSRKKSG